MVPCSDRKAYAEALMRIYHMPEEERLAMGERGQREIRRRYSYSLLAGQYTEILERAEKERS